MWDHGVGETGAIVQGDVFFVLGLYVGLFALLLGLVLICTVIRTSPSDSLWCVPGLWSTNTF